MAPFYSLLDDDAKILDGTKGQLISKTNCQAEDFPKNERMNSFLLVCDVFSFVFWKNPRQEKNRFEIIWPLSAW